MALSFSSSLKIIGKKLFSVCVCSCNRCKGPFKGYNRVLGLRLAFNFS